MEGSSGKVAGVSSPRRLERGDAQRIEAHLIALSPEDRELRFCSAMSDAALAAYVGALDLDTTACYGCFDRGRLVALVEGHAFATASGPCLEAAFTTEAPYRRRGIARQLFATLAADAWRRAIPRIVLSCLVRNRPMRAMLAAVRADASCVDGEVVARWDVRGRMALAQ